MPAVNRSVLVWLLLCPFVTSSYQEFDCDHNMFVNGCSTPFGINFPFSRGTFLPACNRHDVCYQCGAAYGLTRMTCDKRFRNNMKHICMSRMSRRHIFNFARNIFCDKIVNIYFGAVRFGGKHRFTTWPPAECFVPWVRPCL